MIHFAYGPDLNPAWMARNCPGHRSLGIARLTDHWIAFPRYSPVDRSASISIVSTPGDAVWGALYDVPDDDAPVLDYVFGFDPDGSPRLNAHIRRTVDVQRPGSLLPFAVSTYVAVADESRAMPSEAYMMAIFDGARYHGLPRAYLGALQAVKTVSS